MVTPGEKADLEHIANAWGVPLGTCAYAMVATELSAARGASLSSDIFSIEVMAAVRLLAAQTLRHNQTRKGNQSLVRSQHVPGESRPEPD